jgi:hypothetical protein
MSLAMHQWRAAQIRCFVPPGKQLFVEVVFHTPSAENEVRIHDHPHAHDQTFAVFNSTEDERSEWQSPPNEGTATQVYYVEPRFRETLKGPHAAWQHFHDERVSLLWADEHNAVYGCEEGRDADFNDCRISLHWRACEPNGEL